MPERVRISAQDARATAETIQRLGANAQVSQWAGLGRDVNRLVRVSQGRANLTADQLETLRNLNVNRTAVDYLIDRDRSRPRGERARRQTRAVSDWLEAGRGKGERRKPWEVEQRAVRALRALGVDRLTTFYVRRARR